MEVAVKARTRALTFLVAALAVAGLHGKAWADQPAPHSSDQVTEGRTLISIPDTTAYSADERAVLALERGRSGAIARRDTTWLAALYAPDFRGVAGNGIRIERRTSSGSSTGTTRSAVSSSTSWRSTPTAARRP